MAFYNYADRPASEILSFLMCAAAAAAASTKEDEEQDEDAPELRCKSNRNCVHL